MRAHYRAAILVIAAALGAPAGAGDLRSPFTLESAQVLPAGVRSPRFLQLYLSADTRFTENGGFEPLGRRLNRRITWNDVFESQDNEPTRNQIRSILKDAGLDGTPGPGFATGKVFASVDVKAPMFAIGLTERLTAAVVVPLIRADVSVDAGFVSVADGQRFIDEVGKLAPDRAFDAAAKLNNATASKLQRLGYEPLRSQMFSGVGDVQLVGKYLLSANRGGTDALAAKLVLTLPTGAGPNPDRALDIALGDGRTKVGAFLVYDREPFARTRWNVYGGYTALLPSRLVRRLPVSDDDSLSADKENLLRPWGDAVSAGTSFDYRIPAVGVTLTAGYSFQYQGKTRYRGTATDEATRRRYGYLENLEPVQAMHAGVFAVGFSTVEWYRKKAFPLPFQLNVVYSKPFAGKNAPTNGIFAGELVAFF